jgi:hypothetical protein
MTTKHQNENLRAQKADFGTRHMISWKVKIYNLARDIFYFLSEQTFPSHVIQRTEILDFHSVWLIIDEVQMVRRDADGSARVNYQVRNIGQSDMIILWEVDGGNMTEVFMICDAKSAKARCPKAPHVKCTWVIASDKRIGMGKVPGVIFNRHKLAVINEHPLKIHNLTGVMIVDEGFNGQVGQAIIIKPR